MYGYVYKTTNLINGKVYIGRHKSHKYDRWYLGSGAQLRRAVAEYGFDNFSNEVLYYCDSEDELNAREKEAIIQFDSRNPEKGYNVAPGGTKGDWLENRSPEDAKAYRDHMSYLAHIGVSGNKGRHFSEEHKRRIGESNRGKVRTAECRKNLSNAQKGKTAWNKGLTLADDRVRKYARKPGEYVHSPETRAKMSLKAKQRDNATFSRAVIGKIWINNGHQNKMIYPEYFSEYEAQGYIKGRKKRSKGDH